MKIKKIKIIKKFYYKIKKYWNKKVKKIKDYKNRSKIQNKKNQKINKN